MLIKKFNKEHYSLLLSHNLNNNSHRKSFHRAGHYITSMHITQNFIIQLCQKSKNDSETLSLVLLKLKIIHQFPNNEIIPSFFIKLVMHLLANFFVDESIQNLTNRSRILPVFGKRLI